MYETGKRMPNIKVVAIIADVLDVSTSELIPNIEHDDLPAASTVLPGQSVIFDILGDDECV
jgi:transcriptional regulator with XRE-family HTH domain